MQEPSAPKIDGTYRERQNLNVYDSLALSDIRVSAYRLFGNSNIGRFEFCNLAMPGCITSSDRYAVLQNWYSRVSFVDYDLGQRSESDRAAVGRDRDRARADWADSTTVTLVLGTMPVHQLPLADLLRRREGQRDVPSALGDKSDADIAQLMFDTYQRVSVTEFRAQRGETLPPVFGRWELPLGDGGPHPAERSGWVAAAAMARSLLRAPVLCVVPPRQSITVTLETNMEKLDRVLEAGPRDGLRAWVHLEGISCLDIDTAFSKS